MAYSLLRKNTVKSVLHSSCYKIQEPWSIAQLTKNWYITMSQINMPFLEELSFRNYVYLRKYGTTKTSQLPSAECLRVEREYETQRQSYLKSQKKLAERIGYSLRDSAVGLRRPLLPKRHASQN
ncbi:uncharacterized protein C4orf36 homolog [Suncus etruscus]|uniref:uncharacterized protein C4orf36 homolog n=1 Tax=Suncus etruscus TaxID=109475 RepID=UPI0021102051|nr:uncharacterized protein C4orf36 homolog [Suncus etruscus]